MSKTISTKNKEKWQAINKKQTHAVHSPWESMIMATKGKTNKKKGEENVRNQNQIKTEMNYGHLKTNLSGLSWCNGWLWGSWLGRVGQFTVVKQGLGLPVKPVLLLDRRGGEGRGGGRGRSVVGQSVPVEPAPLFGWRCRFDGRGRQLGGSWGSERISEWIRRSYPFHLI